MAVQAWAREQRRLTLVDEQSFASLLERFLILKKEPASLQWYRDWLELPNEENLTDFLRDVFLEDSRGSFDPDYFDGHITKIDTSDATETIYTTVYGYSSEPWNQYTNQLLSKLFVQGASDPESTRSAITRVLEGMPSIRWEVYNVLSRRFLEGAIDGDSDLAISKADSYTGPIYLLINKFFRDLSSQGRAKIDARLFKNTQNTREYRADDLHILSRSVSRIHPFQLLQWLMALSPPLVSNVQVYRWGNGVERDIYSSMAIGDTIRMIGYTSTSLLPWLSIEFSDPHAVGRLRTGRLLELVWDGGDRVVRTDDASQGIDIIIDTARDKPYGMTIDLNAGTRCIYIPTARHAELVLPHGCVLRLERVLTLDGLNGRDMPFFVMQMIDDGIDIVE